MRQAVAASLTAQAYEESPCKDSKDHSEVSYVLRSCRQLCSRRHSAALGRSSEEVRHTGHL